MRCTFFRGARVHQVFMRRAKNFKFQILSALVRRSTLPFILPRRIKYQEFLETVVKCKLSPRSSSAALRQLNLTRKKRPWFFCLYCFINSFANDNEQLETVGNFGNFLSNQPSISQNSLDAAAFQSLVAFWLLHHS